MTGADRAARQVGTALRRVRERRRCPQVRLAAAAAISRARLARFERGREQPGVAVLAALLRALECSADDFGALLGPWGIVQA